MTTKEFSLPFELGQTEHHEIKIFPERKQPLQLLRDKNPEILKILAKYLVEGKEKGSYVISLPKYYGFTAAEEALLKDSSAALRNTFTSFKKLQLSIAKRTGVKAEKIAEYCKDPITHAQHLTEEEIDQILNLNMNTAQNKETLTMVTAVIQQRLDTEWKAEYTMALPALILDDFCYYATKEKLAWKEPEEGKQ